MTRFLVTTSHAIAKQVSRSTTRNHCQAMMWHESGQMLALPGTARRWEPKRLRLRLLVIAGRLARTSRRRRLRLAQNWPWAADITAAATRLQALPSG